MPPLPIVEKDGVLVITFEDSSTLNDGHTAGIRQALYTTLQEKPGVRAAVDLTQIDYISSTGISFLIGIKRRVEASQGHLVIYGLEPDIHDLFSVMKLVNLFEIAPDEEKALELLSPPPAQ